MKTPRRAASTALTLHECKIRASLLLKDLRGEDQPRATRAAERFPILPAFATLETEAILGRRDSIQLKHALAVIAAEFGYPTWTDCKRRLEVPAERRLDTERFFEAGAAAYLNRWFARYGEARASLESESGFLFPFRHQFFICGPDFWKHGASTQPTRTGNGSATTGCVRGMKRLATDSSGCWSAWVTGDKHRTPRLRIRRGTRVVPGADPHRSPRGWRQPHRRRPLPARRPGPLWSGRRRTCRRPWQSGCRPARPRTRPNGSARRPTWPPRPGRSGDRACRG